MEPEFNAEETQDDARETDGADLGDSWDFGEQTDNDDTLSLRRFGAMVDWKTCADGSRGSAHIEP